MRRAVLFALALLVPAAASAHSWYDWVCCSDQDCQPVEDGVVEEKADGVHVKGFPVIPYDDRRLHWSKDDQDHVCIGRNTPEPRILCVYRKPKGF